MLKTLFKLNSAAAATLIMTAGAAMAAGTGTGIETGFTAVGTDLTTLFQGAGGYIFLLGGLLLSVAMLMFGRGWTPAVMTMAGAFIIAYGIPITTGISGASATTDILLDAKAPVELSGITNATM